MSLIDNHRHEVSLKLLLTVGAHRLTQHLADALSPDHTIVLTADAHQQTVHSFVRCDLDDEQATARLTRGVGAIVHFGWVDPEEDASQQLDRQTRQTFNLLCAASEAGVPRVIYLSSLGLMHRYSEKLRVTERWRPAPTTDLRTLAPYLGEIVCREFARERRLQVVCLRLGEVAWKQGSRASVWGLYPKDLVHAVCRALVADLPHFSVFHIQSTVPDQRYDTGEAERVLGLEASPGQEAAR